VEQAIRSAGQLDLMILDAPPNSTAATLRITRAADIVILPTGLSLDDLQLSVLLAHELVKKGVAKVKIAFALCRVGDSHIEVQEAQAYLMEAGYRVLYGSIREKIAYRRDSDEGWALTETRYPTLNERANRLVQSIIDLVSTLNLDLVVGHDVRCFLRTSASPAGCGPPKSVYGHPGRRPAVSPGRRGSLTIPGWHRFEPYL